MLDEPSIDEKYISRSGTDKYYDDSLMPTWLKELAGAWSLRNAI